MHRSSLKRLVVVAGSLGLVACAPAVEGDWETKEKIAGSARRSTMELTADGEGEADIHVVVTDNQGQATCRGDNWGHSRSQTNSIPWKALSPSHSSSSSSLSSQSWRKSSSAMPRPRPLPSSLRSPRSTFREAQRTYEELDRRVREKERELADNYERLRKLENERVLVGERERIMREMHDGMGSSLVSTLSLIEQPSVDRDAIADALRHALVDMTLITTISARTERLRSDVMSSMPLPSGSPRSVRSRSGSSSSSCARAAAMVST